MNSKFLNFEKILASFILIDIIIFQTNFKTTSKSIFKSTIKIMSESLSKIIDEISKISSLQKQKNWFEWKRRLQELLRMQNLWKIFIDEVESKNEDDFTQKQLVFMLQLICVSSIRIVINFYENQSIIKQFQALKKQYKTVNIIIYNTLMHIVFQSSFFDYEIIREYYETIFEVKNRLTNLERFMNELIIIISFIWELDYSYDIWRKNYLAVYVKTFMKFKSNEKSIDRANELNLKDVIKLLINREFVNKIDFFNDEKTRAFETKSQNNEKKSFKKNFNKKKCKHCVEEHKNKDCWYVYLENALNNFIQKFLTNETRKSILKKKEKVF